MIYICNDCGQECEPVEIDMGIGPYEYWGFKGTDINMQWCSPCCESSYSEGDCKLLQHGIRKAIKDYNKEGIIRGQYYSFSVIKYWKKSGPSWIITYRRKLHEWEYKRMQNKISPH